MVPTPINSQRIDVDGYMGSLVWSVDGPTGGQAALALG